MSIFTLLFFSQSFATDCNSINSPSVAQPGQNCNFSIDGTELKLCKVVPSASYPMNYTLIIPVGTAASHRVNCLDLSDLPLCREISGGANPLKNCVNECSAIAGGSGTRSVDYAVHNRDCIRFCDAPEAGVTALAGQNCIRRRCHQSANPNPGVNCEALKCNLLYLSEIDDSKFDDSTKKYCEGDGLKCFEFSFGQLQYAKFRSQNTMCQLHTCNPDPKINDCTPPAITDIGIINGKGSSYVDRYKSNIIGGKPLEEICIPFACKGKRLKYFDCTEPIVNGLPVTKDPNCDSSCSNGACTKTVDCDLPANQSDIICSVLPNEISFSENDDTSSWFYRPKPNPKSMDGDKFRNITQDPNSSYDKICYTEEQMNSYGWGWYLFNKYMHDYLGMDTRSPGKCIAGHDGNRGTGYGYLCGTDGDIYKKPDPNQFAYIRGEVITNYTNDNGIHKINTCLRYNNWMIPRKTCGIRECGITCVFGSCREVCGDEACKELTIVDSKTLDCEMKDEIFGGNPEKSCMKTIGTDGTLDGYLRLRAVKYSNKICTFLDFKGTTGYAGLYFNGSEILDGTKTCVSGKYKTDENGEVTCDGGKNTNDEKEKSWVWRTVMMVPYIINNLSSSSTKKGFYDLNQNFFKEQDCAKVSFRKPPKHLYNLATFKNSPDLFVPPLFILNARVKRGGEISSSPDEIYGKTDFHYPEIEVQFGDTKQKLSLGLGFTGEETLNPDAEGSKTISTSKSCDTCPTMEQQFEAEIFVKKEYSTSNSEPTFCLYRKIKDADGAYLPPSVVGCVRREAPEIDNKKQKIITTSIELRKAIISASSTNTYNKFNIELRYLSSSDVNASSCPSTSNGTTSCTSSAILVNPKTDLPTCDSSVEKHQVCAQREKCSKLNIECIENEVNIYNARKNSEILASLLPIRKDCNESLLKYCNTLKGLKTLEGSSIINPDSAPVVIEPNAYGWFNEVCFIKGFETKLRKIISYSPSSGIEGKCLIDSTSPYLTDGNPATNCDDGGKAPNCLCIGYNSAMNLPNNQKSRYETPHEAGLCIDIPLPQKCNPINYNPSPSSNPDDPDYVDSSIINSITSATYNNTSGVHLSHKARTEGYGTALLNTGHGEFSLALIGMNAVEGECKAFWRKRIDGTGAEVAPKMDCTASGWSGLVDACARYECLAITSQGIDSSGNYQGNYGALESIGTAGTATSDPTPGNKGQSNGYAYWPSYTKTNDFLESVEAKECITGYKNNGATTNKNSSLIPSDVFSSYGYGTYNEVASAYGAITSYNGGNKPIRKCNQIGNWMTPTQICERITCPADDLPTPTSSSQTALWKRWANSGGAVFGMAYASRSDTVYLPESIAIGTCASNLGFFQTIGGKLPTKKCDHLGNWLPVENVCSSSCDAIDQSNAANFNNGFATWSKADVTIGAELKVGSTGCANGYVQNPYPSKRDAYGRVLTRSASGPYRTDSTPDSDTTTPIPIDVKQDPRSSTLPQRTCKSITTVGGKSYSWTATSSSCVAGCPGGSSNTDASDDGLDNRINAGITKHPGYSGEITIYWNSQAFDRWSFKPESANLMAASQFTSNNTTNYALARYCNPTTHKWDDPIPLCVSNNGNVIPSNYDQIPTSSGESFGGQFFRIGSSITSICQTGYETLIGGSNPTYNCQYKPGNNINQVYFAQTSGSACRKYCRSSAGQQFGNAIDISSGSGTVYENGAVLKLGCKDGYGNFITGTESSYVKTTDFSIFNGGCTALGDEDVPKYNCDRIPPLTPPPYGFSAFLPGAKCSTEGSTDRSLNLPQVTCNNGVWSSVANDCSVCRGCTLDSSISSRSGDFTFNSTEYFSNRTANCGQSDCGSRTCSLDLGSGSSANVSHGSSGGPVCRYRAYSCNRSGSLLNEYRCYNRLFFSYTCTDSIITPTWSFGNDNWRSCDGDDWDYSNESEECHSSLEFSGY